VKEQLSRSELTHVFHARCLPEGVAGIELGSAALLAMSVTITLSPSLPMVRKTVPCSWSSDREGTVAKPLRRQQDL